MSKKYTTNELIALLNDEKKLYTNDCLNIKGYTREKIPCCEVLAQNISFKDITAYEKDLKKEFTYKKRKKTEIDTKSEKGLCRCWYLNGEFDEKEIIEKLGKPLQYEVNLVEHSKTNIDLISIKDNTLFLIEVKGRESTKSKPNKYGKNYYFSPETLLRCALEIRTYYKTIQKNIDKFKEHMGYPNANVKMAILIPEDSEAAKQWKNQVYPNTNKFVTGDNSIENPEIEVVLFKGNEKKKYIHK